MKKKGFTLIELLAVIIILGILMLVAIPSVTSYINNSRKETYISTIRELIKATVTKVNSGELDIYDTNTTYYIPTSALDLENGDPKSPYGEIEDAYVVVTYDGEEYDYYYVGKDETGMGIENITKEVIIDNDFIEDGIEEISTDVGIKGKSEIVVFNDELEPGPSVEANIFTDGNGKKPVEVIKYPKGKTKKTVDVGDLVKIGDEEFYVVRHDGADLVLLAHYNLKVGIIHQNMGDKLGEYTQNDEGYGLQSSEARGYINYDGISYGTVAFSEENYSYNNVGEGLKYPGNDHGPDFPYTYDENSNLYPYVENYRDYLEGLGAPIQDARLLSFDEAIGLGCEYDSTITFNYCRNTPSFFKETSFWMGSTEQGNALNSSVANGYLFRFTYFKYDTVYGVRPVIVI